MPNSLFKYLSLVVDAIFVNLAFVFAFLLRFSGTLPPENFSAYLRISPLITIVYLAAGWIYGLYDSENVGSFWDVTRAAVYASTLGALLTAAIAFFGGVTTIAFARWTILFAWVIAAVLLIAWRIALLRFFPISYPEKRVLILGANQTGADLARTLRERTKWGWHFIGFIDAHEKDQKAIEPAIELIDVSPEVDQSEILGSISDLEAVVKKHQINRLLIAKPTNIRQFIESLVLSKNLRLTIDVVPDLYEVFIGQADSIVGDVPLMRVATAQSSHYQSGLKRLGDFVGFICIGILTLPVWVFAMLGILIDDGWPIFYRQERVGKRQKVFEIFKFRTMINDAESCSGPVMACEGDTRITRFGSLLRRARIDELPQLINIARGEMSFIGPRPERPIFVEEFLKDVPGYAERFEAKPGVTGLAQVNGSYATTPERKLKYDLMYIYNQGLTMDLQVIAETIKVVLTGRGAR